MNITREFPITERLRLQFRGEFFNLPNTSHFNGHAERQRHAAGPTS